MISKRMRVSIAIACIAMVLLSVFVCYYFKRNYSILHLSPSMCEISLNGVSPETFCRSKGAGTWIEGKYLFANVDNDGCLILAVKNDVISAWKSTYLELQILQCVIGSSRDIGVTVDYSMDFMSLMENADTCGYEISEDFSKVVHSPGDNHWYFPFIVTGCATMQMFDGETCSENYVEFTEIDENGKIVEKIVFQNGVATTAD